MSNSRLSLVFCWAVLMAAVCRGSVIVVPEVPLGVFESGTFTNIDSWDGLGDPDNVVLSQGFVGGYTSDQLRATGTLTEQDPISNLSFGVSDPFSAAPGVD